MTKPHTKPPTKIKTIAYMTLKSAGAVSIGPGSPVACPLPRYHPEEDELHQVALPAPDHVPARDHFVDSLPSPLVGAFALRLPITRNVFFTLFFSFFAESFGTRAFKRLATPVSRFCFSSGVALVDVVRDLRWVAFGFGQSS